MNNQQHTKPEPISAKLNWHYDAYFLSQLERLGLRKFHAEQSVQDLDSEQSIDDLTPPEQTTPQVDTEDSTR